MTEQTSAEAAADPFFCVVNDGQWNACVGIQGSAENYVDGYIEAALELVTAVIEKRMVASRDTLAMPILYNCRHGLELALKFAIDRLHDMKAVANLHPVNHDILSHWRHLHDAGIGDTRLKKLIVALEPFVKSLAAIDEDGQELRYALNREGQKSLSGIAVVNLPLIRQSIEQMSGILHQLKERVHEMEEERTTGSHTKECSRADLEKIASILGNHATWRDPNFNEKKASIRKIFGLSSRKLSAAIDAIRKSRPLASRVGLETDLKHLSDEKAVGVLEGWVKAHAKQACDFDNLGTDYFRRDWDKFQAHTQQTHELDKAVLQLLNVEELSDLKVLFYIGRDRALGEHYDDYLAGTIAEHLGNKPLLNAVNDLMSKTNLLDAVVEGARAVGRPSLAAKLRALRAEVDAVAERPEE
jgi:hypothetical protein